MSRKEQIKKWCNEHFTQLLMAGLFVGGCVVGGVLAYDKGYSKALHSIDYDAIEWHGYDRAFDEVAAAANGEPVHSKRYDPLSEKIILNDMILKDPETAASFGLTADTVDDFGLFTYFVKKGCFRNDN